MFPAGTSASNYCSTSQSWSKILIGTNKWPHDREKRASCSQRRLLLLRPSWRRLRPSLLPPPVLPPRPSAAMPSMPRRLPPALAPADPSCEFCSPLCMFKATIGVTTQYMVGYNLFAAIFLAAFTRFRAYLLDMLIPDVVLGTLLCRVIVSFRTPNDILLLLVRAFLSYIASFTFASSYTGGELSPLLVFGRVLLALASFHISVPEV